MQLQQLSIWREQITKAMNQPRSFILKNATMIDLVEKNPRNTFQLAQVKDMRPNIVREHGKTILDLLFLPPEMNGHCVWHVLSKITPKKLHLVLIY
jgi:ribonuclease D